MYYYLKKSSLLGRGLILPYPLSDTSIEETFDEMKATESEKNTNNPNVISDVKDMPDTDEKSNTSEASDTKHEPDTNKESPPGDLVSATKQIKSDLKLALEKGDHVMRELTNENARILSSLEAYDPSEMDDLFDEDESETSSLSASPSASSSAGPSSINSYYSYQSQGSRDSLTSPVCFIHRSCFFS